MLGICSESAYLMARVCSESARNLPVWGHESARICSESAQNLLRVANLLGPSRGTNPLGICSEPAYLRAHFCMASSLLGPARTTAFARTAAHASIGRATSKHRTPSPSHPASRHPFATDSDNMPLNNSTPSATPIFTPKTIRHLANMDKSAGSVGSLLEDDEFLKRGMDEDGSFRERYAD